MGALLAWLSARIPLAIMGCCVAPLMLLPSLAMSSTQRTGERYGVEAYSGVLVSNDSAILGDLEWHEHVGIESALGRRFGLLGGGISGEISEPSGRSGDCGRQEDEAQAHASNNVLFASVYGGIFCRFSRPSLKADIITPLLFFAIFGSAFVGGFLIPQRPKLGVAIFTTGLVALLLAFYEITVGAC